jgi:hypothetical protein
MQQQYMYKNDNGNELVKQKEQQQKFPQEE